MKSEANNTPHNTAKRDHTAAYPDSYMMQMHSEVEAAVIVERDFIVRDTPERDIHYERRRGTHSYTHIHTHTRTHTHYSREGL